MPRPRNASETTPLLTDDSGNDTDDELTTNSSVPPPLLKGVSTRQDAPETPLPKLQLFIVYYIQVAEPMTSMVISPFINEVRRILMSALSAQLKAL